MNMFKVGIITVSLFTIQACAPANPIISDFNGDSVKIQNHAFETDTEKANLIEAGRICAKQKKKAEYASTRNLPNYMVEHLYLCL